MDVHATGFGSFCVCFFPQIELLYNYNLKHSLLLKPLQRRTIWTILCMQLL